MRDIVMRKFQLGNIFEETFMSEEKSKLSQPELDDQFAIAAENHNLEKMKALVLLGAKPEKYYAQFGSGLYEGSNKYGYKAITDMVYSNTKPNVLDIVKFFVEELKVDLNEIDWYGSDVLLESAIACRSSSSREVFEYLLEQCNDSIRYRIKLINITDGTWFEEGCKAGFDHGSKAGNGVEYGHFEELSSNQIFGAYECKLSGDSNVFNRGSTWILNAIRNPVLLPVIQTELESGNNSEIFKAMLISPVEQDDEIGSYVTPLVEAMNCLWEARMFDSRYTSNEIGQYKKIVETLIGLEVTHELWRNEDFNQVDVKTLYFSLKLAEQGENGPLNDILLRRIDDLKFELELEADFNLEVRQGHNIYDQLLNIPDMAIMKKDKHFVITRKEKDIYYFILAELFKKNVLINEAVKAYGKVSSDSENHDKACYELGSIFFSGIGIQPMPSALEEGNKLLDDDEEMNEFASPTEERLLVSLRYFLQVGNDFAQIYKMRYWVAHTYCFGEHSVMRTTDKLVKEYEKKLEKLEGDPDTELSKVKSIKDIYEEEKLNAAEILMRKYMDKTHLHQDAATLSMVVKIQAKSVNLRMVVPYLLGVIRDLIFLLKIVRIDLNLYPQECQQKNIMGHHIKLARIRAHSTRNPGYTLKI